MSTLGQVSYPRAFVGTTLCDGLLGDVVLLGILDGLHWGCEVQRLSDGKMAYRTLDELFLPHPAVALSPSVIDTVFS
jgi:hypothetical protein